MKTKTWLIPVLAALFLFAGCGGDKDTPPPPPPDQGATLPVVEPEDHRTPVAGATLMSDGRKVGGLASGKIGDELTNVFFAFCVNQAELTDEYEGRKADRGFLWLVAEVTVKSAFSQPIPMWADDFIAQWGDGENDYCYPQEKYTDAQMEKEFTLDGEEGVTAVLVYEVPLSEIGGEYSISYLEYYEDKVEGNLFLINFTLEREES